jgi:hypothetical protein
MADHTNAFYTIMDGLHPSLRRARHYVKTHKIVDLDCSQLLYTSKQPLIHRWASSASKDPKLLSWFFEFLKDNGGVTEELVLYTQTKHPNDVYKLYGRVPPNALISAMQAYSGLALEILMKCQSLNRVWNVKMPTGSSPLLEACRANLDYSASRLVNVTNDETINRHTEPPQDTGALEFEGYWDCPLRVALEHNLPLTVAALLRRPGLMIANRGVIEQYDGVHIDYSSDGGSYTTAVEQSLQKLWRTERHYTQQITPLLIQLLHDIPVCICAMISKYVCCTF